MEVLDASLKEQLWHDLQRDLAAYSPGVIHDERLMCCACARFLPREHFTLEHIVPQQVLGDDPPEVRALTTKNARSRLTLLCSKPIKIGDKTYSGGCNGWKGRHYDGCLRQALNRSLLDGHRKAPSQHTIAVFCTAYLAMVHHFGYQIALTPAGAVARRQFFSPRKFRSDVPARSQMLLLGKAPSYEPDRLSVWTNPFSFKVLDNGACSVAIKNAAVLVPISRDPRLPIAQRILVPDSGYILRPDFTISF